MDQKKEHDSIVQENLMKIAGRKDFFDSALEWLIEANRLNYMQNFSWLGRPIVQIPQDIYVYQELIWRLRPDLIIETGIAHGGSLILSASMLALLDFAEAVQSGEKIDPTGSRRKVVGIDIDIRAHNRAALEAHPFFSFLHLIEGSSIDPRVVGEVRDIAKRAETVLVFLDSDHTHAHVLAELQAYAPLVTPGAYCVVWDTGVDNLPEGFVTNRPWGPGNNPKTAVFAYLDMLKSKLVLASDGERLAFKFDKTLECKIVATASWDGFLRRVKA